MAIPVKGPVWATQEKNKVASTIVVGAKNVAAAGTDEALVATSTPLTSGITVQAKGANTGDIYVGLVGVAAATGYVLAAGESVFLPVDNANKIYVDAEVSAEGVNYIGS